MWLEVDKSGVDGRVGEARLQNSEGGNGGEVG